MEMIDIIRPNPNIILEETTTVSVTCPCCGDIERVEIENSCLSEMEIILEELNNPELCGDCQNFQYQYSENNFKAYDQVNPKATKQKIKILKQAQKLQERMDKLKKG